MTKEKAHTIFKDWKEYIEFGNQLSAFFTVVPKYFLPYPIEVLEEALNIVAKEYFDAGDRRMANNIQELMVLHLGGYYKISSDRYKTDDEILEEMKKKLEFILANPDVKKAIIEGLKEAQDSWIRFRESGKTAIDPQLKEVPR